MTSIYHQRGGDRDYDYRHVRTRERPKFPMKLAPSALKKRSIEVTNPDAENAFLDTSELWGAIESAALRERLRSCAATLPAKLLHARAAMLRHLSEAETDAIIRLAVDNLQTLEDFPAIGALRTLLPLHLRWEICRRFHLREHGGRAAPLLLDTAVDLAAEESESAAVGFILQMIPKILGAKQWNDLRCAVFEQSPLPEWMREAVYRRFYDAGYVSGTVLETTFRGIPRFEMRTARRIYVHRHESNMPYLPHADEIACFHLDDVEYIGADHTDEKPRKVFLVRFLPFERAGARETPS